MLIVLVGAPGAGKTTLLELLRPRGTTVLQPTTTRLPRFPGESEYEFVQAWDDALYAWKIKVGQDYYGLRKSELDLAVGCTCVTVFEPLNLEVFEGVRRSLAMETMTVGLNTISGLAEQRRRVAGNSTRRLDEASLAKVSEIVATCDVVLEGDATTVLRAVESVLRLLAGRGGVLTKDYLQPMIAAGSLLSDVDPANIRSASYDLRVGREILCQGEQRVLTDDQPHFEIPPYSYAIVSAYEQASLPPFVAGRFDLKVSFFFEGVILSNGPQIDPNYKGALFCMLYNGSGRSKLLTLRSHFATIDFTTTTTLTEGYRQQYRLKSRMHQFATQDAVTGREGGIVALVERKVSRVNGKIKALQRNFLILVGAAITLFIGMPAVVIPVLWIEIGYLHGDKVEAEKAEREVKDLLASEEKERADAAKRTDAKQSSIEAAERRVTDELAAAKLDRQVATKLLGKPMAKSAIPH